MNTERWRRIEEMFLTLADRPASEREVYLTRVCGGDEDLRREVLSLLAEDDPEDFIREPIAGAALSYKAEARDDLTGARIGPYRLTRLVGRGGMGAVYEAVRDDGQFRQQVALKIIRRGMDTDFVRDRFLRERQILASLDHPHIARLLDGGATPDGRPYFVMEFVAGEPITDYCRRRQLSLNDKLKLFRDICSAVQHAHQKLVIHRDLKPGNILITPSADGKAGAPRLLDFGIAKLLAPDTRAAVAQTETALRLMTPDYASPEQVRGDAITTTTDVYSLGVVLYELLTGRRPHQFKNLSPAEIERAICDAEIEEPSKVVSRMKDAPARLARQLAGDLDNIALMALRKEPERRYQSVEQFSEDIRRHLAGLPVVARKDTFGYRAGKFVRRHKLAVGFVATVLALLLGVAITMAAQAARISRERDRANLEAATAKEVTEFLVGSFELADPSEARGRAVTAREVLDRSAAKVERELKDQPEVQARLMEAMGRVYQKLGLYGEAESLLRRSLELRRGMGGMGEMGEMGGVADLARTLNFLGEVLYEKRELKEAEAALREALALRRALGERRPEVAESLNNVGAVLWAQNDLAGAGQFYREALALRRELFGPEHAEVAESLTNLAVLHHTQKDYAGAEPLYVEALAIKRKLLGQDHPATINGMNNLGVLLRAKGDLATAELMLREALAIRKRVLGEEHPEVAESLIELASTLRATRQFEEAEQLFLAALALRQKVLGDAHPQTRGSLNRLIRFYEAWGKPEQAARYRALLPAPSKP
jgi:serine/threonine-protein kinase